MNLADAEKQFRADTADHELTVVREEGVFRYLRCAAPGNPFNWFEVVTWPGSLAITGDFGNGFVFSRIPDMLAFFRAHTDKDPGINPGYWVQKVTAGAGDVTAYSPRAFRATVAEALRDHEVSDLFERLCAQAERLGLRSSEIGLLPDAVAQKCRAATRAYMAALRAAADEWMLGDDAVHDVEHEAVAVHAAYEFEFRAPDAADDDEPFRFEDVGDWAPRVREFSREFLWACRAVRWAVERYDAQRASREAAAPVTAAGGLL